MASPMARLSRMQARTTAAWFDGTCRRAASVRTGPIVALHESLAEFLCLPGGPLSARAEGGFVGRLVAGSLRRKPGFVEAVRDHIAAMDPARAFSLAA